MTSNSRPSSRPAASNVRASLGTTCTWPPTRRAVKLIPARPFPRSTDIGAPSPDTVTRSPVIKVTTLSLTDAASAVRREGRPAPADTAGPAPPADVDPGPSSACATHAGPANPTASAATRVPALRLFNICSPSRRSTTFPGSVRAQPRVLGQIWRDSTGTHLRADSYADLDLPLLDEHAHPGRPQRRPTPNQVARPVRDPRHVEGGAVHHRGVRRAMSPARDSAALSRTGPTTLMGQEDEPGERVGPPSP